MRGFQILPQNLNQKIFDPLLARNMLEQKGVKRWAKNGGNMLLDLNCDAIFEILSSFSISYESICYDFHVLKF